MIDQAMFERYVNFEFYKTLSFENRYIDVV